MNAPILVDHLNKERGVILIAGILAKREDNPEIIRLLLCLIPANEVLNIPSNTQAKAMGNSGNAGGE